MAVLPIYTYGAPILRKKARSVKQVSDEVVTLIMDMFETMRKASGIGLAATQVGSLDRVAVIDVSEMEEFKGVKPITLINPEVISSVGALTMEEGCLSIPEVRDDVERAETITLSYKDSSLQSCELEASGLLARVILHEIDHLDGILFVDRIAPARRKEHAEELKKIQKGDMVVNYPVVTAVDIAA